jgi:N-acetylglucosamine-6-phosphate deacetylase
MMMQKKLNITPGDWVVDLDETYGVRDNKGGRLVICTNLKGRNGMGGRRTPTEVAANATLIADAGTTYNRTGLLPSELAAQRDELLEVLKRVREYWQYSETNPVSTQTIDAAIKRCQP